MALPRLVFRIKDPSGEFAGTRTTGLPAAALGICASGEVGEVYDLETPEAAKEALGDGPLTEYAAMYLAATEPFQAPRPLYAVPVTPSTFGTNGAVTESKTGTGTVTPGLAPRRQILITCTLGGALGTAEFTFQLGDDEPSSPVVSAAGWAVSGYLVPGTLTRLTFPAGTYVATSTCTVSNVAGITSTGGSATAGSVTSSDGPFRILPGQTTVIDIDQAGDQTFTWSGTRGFLDGAAGVFAGVAGTVVVRVNEQASTYDQTITFTGASNTIALALQEFNDQLLDATAINNGGQVRIRSDRYGDDSNIRIVSGTGALLTDLGLAAGLGTAGGATVDDGGGAVAVPIAFLDEATAAEIDAAFATPGVTLTGGTLVDSGDALVLTTNTTGASPKGVRVKPASTNTLGFDTTEHNGTAAGPIASITQSSSPLDRAEIVVTCTTAGALGVGEFEYSLDGGDTVIGPIQIPGGGKYHLGDSGVYVTFANVFEEGDAYTWTATAASASSSDYTTGLTTLLATSRIFDHVLVTGTPASAAAAAALAAALDVALATAFTNYRFAYAIITTPTQGVSDSTISAAFASTNSSRVMCAAGDTEHVSARGGARIDRRPGGWELSIRCAQIAESVDPLATALGPLQGVTSIYRDEATSATSLDSQRFATLRSWVGKTGYFVTRGRMLAAIGSDFGDVPRRRVMDAACRVVYDVMWLEVGANLRLLTDGSGFIDPRDADVLDQKLDDALRAAIGNQVSGVRGRVSRTTDISADSTPIPVEVAIVPLKVGREITVTFGYARSL